MTEFITPADLAPFADIPDDRCAAMIADAVAKATRAAPCITSSEFTGDETGMADLKRILRTAILRWNESGSGALASYSEGAGVYSSSQTFDTRQPWRAVFRPSEIRELRSLCGGGGAYTIDMTGPHRRLNPLYGATINAEVGAEPWGHWSDQCLGLPGIVW